MVRLKGTIRLMANEAQDQTQISHSFAARVSGFYGAMFLVVGLYMAYFPVHLNSLSFSPTEISIVLSTPLFVRLFFTPVLTNLADTTFHARSILIVLSMFALLAAFGFGFVTSFAAMLLVALAFNLSGNSLMPLTETVAMDGVRRAGLNYGRMRLWGSITFIFATFLGGVIVETFGNGSILPMIVAASACVAIAALLLPQPTGQKRLKAALPGPKLSIAGSVELVRSPLFCWFLLAVCAAQSSHAVLYAFGTLNWQAQGISSTMIGGLWALGVFAEILLFYFSSGPLRIFGALGLIAMGCIAGMIRWTWTAFDPSLGVLVPLQILHGFTFGAAHLGAIYFMKDLVPERLVASAQGLYAALTSGVGIALATLVSGPLYGSVHGRAFLAMTVLSTVGLLALLVAHNKWRSGQSL